MASKEPKEKKEKKEKKEDKEDKKDKKEKKEKKEKDAGEKPSKDKPKLTGSGFSLWDSTAPNSEVQSFAQIQEPADKRKKQAEKEKQAAKDGPALIKTSDIITQTLMKNKEQVKAAKKEEEAKRAKANREAKMQVEVREQEQETFQIMDKSGAGNFMEKRDVMEVMKNSLVDAVTSAGSRCQVSSRTIIDDKVFMNRNASFQTLGDFKTTGGFVYLRGLREEPGVKFRLTRPATVYACLSESSGDDPYLGSWKVLEEGKMSPPEYDGNLPAVTEVRHKVYKDPRNREVSVPKPPPGLEIVLVFVVPDFHGSPFPAEEETEEEMLARQRKEGAEKRAGKSGEATKKEEASLESKIEAVLEKVAKGEKLTNKEKRLHEKHLEKNPVYKDEDEEHAKSGLKAFTLTLEGGKCDPPGSADAFVCDNFSLSAPGQTLFDNATISIVQGKRYGILGPNGMGKTTILRHIASRDMPVPLNWDVILVEQEAKASDRTAVEEVLAADTRTADILTKEGELLQKLSDMEKMMENNEEVDIDELERTRHALEMVAVDLEAYGAESAEARVRKILCGLGFSNGKPDEDRFSMDRPVVQFSGGWRMRISLAKALFLQPKLLMLDEPTNHLDLDAVLWLDNYLSEVYPHAVIVVSHDADFLDNICTDIMHLEDKKLVHYRGDYTAFKKMHKQKRAQLDSEFKKQQDELKALKRKGKTREEAEELIKKKFGIDLQDGLMEKLKDYIVKFSFVGHGMDRSLGLNVSEVAFSYNGQKPYLLTELEIGIDCGSRVAIVGPNGGGKSTLLNLMMQRLEPCEGDVQCSKGIRVRQYHQHFEELLPLEKTGIEYLSSAFDLSPPEKARAVLGQFGLPGASHHTKIGNLSGGQKARVAFSALMLQQPHIIVLDEPTNHLDIESVEALTSAISKFNGGLVLVSHDARLITEVDCDLWVVEDGTCYRFEKGFDGYRDKVLDQLREREEEVERMEVARREARAKLRQKHVDLQRIQAAVAKKMEDGEVVQKVMSGGAKKKAADDQEEASSSKKKAPNGKLSSEDSEEAEKKGKSKEKKAKEEKEDDSGVDEAAMMEMFGKKKKKDKEKKEKKASSKDEKVSAKKVSKKDESDEESEDDSHKKKGNNKSDKKDSDENSSESEEEAPKKNLSKGKDEKAKKASGKTDKKGKKFDPELSESSDKEKLPKKVGKKGKKDDSESESESEEEKPAKKGKDKVPKMSSKKGKKAETDSASESESDEPVKKGKKAKKAEIESESESEEEVPVKKGKDKKAKASAKQSGKKNKKVETESESESEEEVPKQKSKDKNAKVSAKSSGKKGKKVESSSGSESEEKAPAKKSKDKNAKEPAKGKKGKKVESSSASESEEEAPPKKSKDKNAKVSAKSGGKKGKKVESSSESESEEEAPPKKSKDKNAKVSAKSSGKKGKQIESSSESESEEEAPVKKSKNKNAKVSPKQVKKDKRAETSSESESEEELPVKKGKEKNSKAPASKSGKKGKQSDTESESNDKSAKKSTDKKAKGSVKTISPKGKKPKSESEESGDEEPVKKGNGKKSKDSTPSPKNAETDSDEDNSDDDVLLAAMMRKKKPAQVVESESEEEEEPVKKENEKVNDGKKIESEQAAPKTKKEKLAAAKAAPKKGGKQDDDDEEQVGQKQQGKKGKGGFDDEDDSGKKKNKGKKGRKGRDDEDEAVAEVKPADAEVAAEEVKEDKAVPDDEESEDDVDINAKHSKYIVAEIVQVRPLKAKKGYFFSEMDTGGEENVTVVTNCKNLVIGHKIILAPEGSTVKGKKVVGEHLFSEWSAGAVASPVDMDWKGDALSCVRLQDSANVGKPAPASKRSPLLFTGDEVVSKADDEDAGDSKGKKKNAKKGNEEDDEPKKVQQKKGKKGSIDDQGEDDDEPKKGQQKKGKQGKADDDDDDVPQNKAKAKAKANQKKGKRRGDDTEDEEDEDEAPKGKAKAKAKAGSKKGKRGGDDDDDEDEPKGKAKTKAGKKGKRGGDDSDDDDEETSKGKANQKRDDHDDDGEDDGDDDDDEPWMKAKAKAAAETKAKAAEAKAKAKAKAKGKKKDDDFDDEDDTNRKSRQTSKALDDADDDDWDDGKKGGKKKGKKK